MSRLYSGIITELGTVSKLVNGRLTVRAPKSCATIDIADSIAVNGTCLTVVERTAEFFGADISSETANLTTLSSLKKDDAVNLELPLTFGGRVGGHLVQGHIDGRGKVQSITPQDGSNLLTISAPPNIMKYVMVKGSVAVDGVGLTITAKQARAFGVAVVGYTLQNTTIGGYQIGTPVNIEVDMIIKGLELLTENYKDANAR